MLLGKKQEFAIEFEKKDDSQYSYLVWINGNSIGNKNDSEYISGLESFLESVLNKTSCRQLKNVDPIEIFNFCKASKKFTGEFIDIYELFFDVKIDVDDLIERNLASSFDDFLIVSYNIDGYSYILAQLISDASVFNYDGYTRDVVFCKVPHSDITTIINNLNKVV